MEFLGLLMLLSARAFADATYVPPRLDSNFIDSAKLTLNEEKRVETATFLGVQVRGTQHYQKNLGPAFMSRALGIALKLDAHNKTAYVANAVLTRGDPLMPTGDAVLSVNEFSQALTKTAVSLMQNLNTEDAKLGAYLCWLAKRIDPRNDDAIFNLELYLEKNKLDWDWAPAVDEGQETARPPAQTGGPTPDSAAKPEVTSETSKNKKFMKRLSTIKGLVVQQLPNGEHMGSVLDIIIVAKPLPSNSHSGTLGIQNRVGDEMQISFDEARRFVDVRYPFWEASETRVSFGDKYTPKDGGSAGAAFAILMLSLFDNFDIDQTVAITGDVTVDGKIRKVGGIAAKIRGAMMDGCKYVLIPKENEEQVQDMMLLYPLETLWRVQILSVNNVDEAIGLLKPKQEGETSAAFDKFALFRGENEKSGFYKKKEARETLEEIAKSCPQHVSAKYLLELAAGNMPKTLSRSASLARLFNTIGPCRQSIFYNQLVPMNQDQYKGMSGRLSSMRGLVHPDIKSLYESCSSFLSSAQKLQRARDAYNAGSTKQNQINLTGAEGDFTKCRNTLVGRLNEMEANSNLMEKVIREGI